VVLLCVEPKKILIKNRKNKLKSDESNGHHIEGEFGPAKRGFSLHKVMAKLSESSITVI